MYNHYLPEKGYTLVYNHLTNSIGRIMNQVELAKIQQTLEQGQIPDSPLFACLVRDGFFVDDTREEEYAAEVRYTSRRYHSGLDATILASEQCNFRCVYCYEEFKRGNISEAVINAFIRYIRKNLRNYTSVSLGWFGGEPLLAAKEIERISTTVMDICARARKPFTASMTSNGYLLDVPMMERMLRCKVSHYQITLDGLAESHNKTRVLANGGSSFERIITNLRAIHDQVKSQFFQIAIRMNVTKSQIPLMQEYAVFMAAEFGQDPRFSFLFRPAGDWGGERVHSVKDELVSSLDAVYDTLLQSGTKLNYDINLDLMGNSTCYAADRNSFILGSDGTIYKCTVRFDQEYNRLGHISENGDLLIDYTKLDRWLVQPARKTEGCAVCAVWALCRNRTCPAKTFDVEGHDVKHCGYERESLDPLIRLMDRSNSDYITVYE
jgi:uncharacterized protein